MPDVHVAEDVCVGVAVATAELLYPQAVGGDIGCGMLAVPFGGANELARFAKVCRVTRVMQPYLDAIV
jgi:tRNA-splicing ligase RtcB